MAIKVKLPVIDDNGFIHGRTWASEGQSLVMINSTQVRRINVNVGNNPPAHRIQFIDGTPDLDILAEMAE